MHAFLKQLVQQPGEALLGVLYGRGAAVYIDDNDCEGDRRDWGGQGGGRNEPWAFGPGQKQRFGLKWPCWPVLAPTEGATACA